MENAGMEAKLIPTFIATVVSKGSRINIYNAKDYVKEKCEEGLFDSKTMDRIFILLNKYKRWR